MSSREFQRIDAARALAFLFRACDEGKPYTLFDVRDAHSFSHGAIPTAIGLSEHDVGTWLMKLPRSQPILIYCFQGFSSQTFAKTFADFGFSEVYSIDGGFPALREALLRARDAAGDDSAASPPAES